MSELGVCYNIRFSVFFTPPTILFSWHTQHKVSFQDTIGENKLLVLRPSGVCYFATRHFYCVVIIILYYLPDVIVILYSTSIVHSSLLVNPFTIKKEDFH